MAENIIYYYSNEWNFFFKVERIKPQYIVIPPDINNC